MAREYVTIPKEMYLWAIERAGYDVGEFLKTHPDIAMYVEDEKKPTIKQLEGFASSVHVPMAYLLLPSPPVETSPIPMFRGKAGSGRPEDSEIQADGDAGSGRGDGRQPGD